MADEHVPDDRFQFGGKTFDGVHGFGNGFKFHHDVAEKLAFDGVADSALETKFVELADVVENRGGGQQINVKLGIVRGGLFAEAQQAYDWLRQTAAGGE